MRDAAPSFHIIYGAGAHFMLANHKNRFSFVVAIATALPIGGISFAAPTLAAPYVKICNSGAQAGTGSCPVSPPLGAGINDWACTRDTATNLMWEVKTATGTRGYGKAYTSFDDPSKPQKMTGANPTAAEVSAATNVMGYLAAANTAGMCGSTAWRRPTYTELQALVVANAAPNTVKIETTYFPNSGYGHPVLLPYATSTESVGTPVKKMYMVNFYTGLAQEYPRDHPSHVRLVTAAGGPICQTFTLDESNPWQSSAQITLPGAPKKLVSITGSYTVATYGTAPAQTQSIIQPPANQPKAGPFPGALGNKYINIFMLPSGTALPKISGSGVSDYVNFNQALNPGTYLVTGMSAWADGTIHAHGNITGTLTLCVQ